MSWLRVALGASLLFAACDGPSKHEKQLDRYYEIEWVKCVNELGIDRCKVIQETGFRQCQNYKSRHGGIDGCVEERFNDRFRELSNASETSPTEHKAEAPKMSTPVI